MEGEILRHTFDIVEHGAVFPIVLRLYEESGIDETVGGGEVVVGCL